MNDPTAQLPPQRGAERTWSPIVELRQYTTHPGQRDALITLFESRFIEPQEKAGMKLIGHFRNLDDADNFTWVRGFADMPTRFRALSDFYDGPIWRANRDAANATITDSTNVLLLQPSAPTGPFELPAHRPPAGGPGDEKDRGAIEVTILHIETAAEAKVAAYVEAAIAPSLAHSGASLLTTLVTKHAVNDFPRLPVRDGVHVFVWFVGFPQLAAYERLQRVDMPHHRLAERTPGLMLLPEVLRLAPTPRSLLTGSFSLPADGK
jgi:hypothetical protein